MSGSPRAGASAGAKFTTRPELIGTFGAVSSTHWLASAVGMSILELGGNAFDAAVATGFALQIVEPHLCGPAGDMPAIFYSSRDRAVRVLCAQGTAPAAASIAKFRELGLGMIPGTGLLAATVPGAFDGWMLLLREFGSMTVEQVLEPAIIYAENGFPILPRLTMSLLPLVDFFKAEWPSSAAVWLPGGQPPQPRTLFATPAVAKTYKRLLAEAIAAGSDREQQIEAARNAFYRGFVAEAIDKYATRTPQMDGTGGRHVALLTADDMAGWRATLEVTTSYDYGRYRVHKTGPWGQGPVLLQQLALLKGFDLGALPPESADLVHVVTECAKLAFADREAFYGDPAFSDTRLTTLLSDAYNNERRALLTEHASMELRPGLPDISAPRIETILALARACPTPVGPGGGEPTFAELPEHRADTVHLDVIDRWGNMIAATPSGGWFQSSPVIPELGFPLGTRAQMFWLAEGLPSSLEPRARPRTTLSPTLVERDGEPYLVCGSPGGDQQDQWTLLLLLRHFHYRLNLQEAIDSPMFNSMHFPSSFTPRASQPGAISIESRFGPETLNDLERRGHRLKVTDGWSLGRLCAASSYGGVLTAAATPRHMEAYAICR
ncbi:MAG TPA: gamma-glutamyltransferase family protein [Roseiarcus sp.]|nr:gamma-glutamyltransferase family protein [Roseiarcus sp.]